MSDRIFLTRGEGDEQERIAVEESALVPDNWRPVNTGYEYYSRPHWDDLGFIFPEPPAPELPTEPGWYLDGHGEVWRLDENGWAFGNRRGTGFEISHPVTPFTRLYTEPELAPIIAEKIAAWADDTFELAIGDEIRREFGGQP